ncbi:glutathione S-transferase N-terminal domain-containing protein [Paraburkholderia tropica]|uniref:glutathione S-transferase N-terminal domain-containing protein n=1 Tax=Paraburkholderia tropica TaxID=92647 RepID=UPI002AB676F0|nr:glutathione S-transferase N-terminal domain-containing protein [Paraburkholderia tropica]
MITTEEMPVLYGAAWSVYVRIARLALEEKQVTYDLVEVGVFAKTGVPPEHLNRHPFDRIPAFALGNFHLIFTKRERSLDISTLSSEANCSR